MTMSQKLVNFKLLLYLLFLAPHHARSGSNEDFIVRKFVGNLIRVRQWREVIIVDCSRYYNEAIAIWKKELNERTFVKVVAENQSAEDVLSRTVVESCSPIIVLPSCNNSFQFITEASHLHFINKFFSWWLLFHAFSRQNIGALNSEFFKHYLKNINLTLDSNMNAVRINAEAQMAEVFDVYKIGLASDDTLHVNIMGEWHYNKTQVALWPSFYVDKIKKRMNMKGYKLRVAALKDQPDYNYDCETRLRVGSEELVGGYSAELIKTMSHLLNFTIKTISADTWGILQDTWEEKRRWNGMIGLLVANRADVALCHPTITKDRMEVVDFLHPTLQTSRTLVYRHSEVAASHDVFVVTFTGTFWICWLLVLTTLVTALRVSSIQHAKIAAIAAKNKNKHRAWTWIEVSLWAIAASCQQEFSLHPRGVSCKVVFMIGYLTAYLLYTGFSAGVTSLMATGINNRLQLGDVLRMKLDLGIYGRNMENFLWSLEDPVLRRLLETRLSNPDNYQHSFKEAVGHMHKKHFVTMASETVVKHYLAKHMSAKDACAMTSSQISGSKHFKAFAVQKHSPFKDIFNYCLLKIQETGLLHIIQQQYLDIPLPCDSNPSFSSAGLPHVFSAVCILCIGLLLSLLLLFMEFAWWFHNHSRRWRDATRKDVLFHLREHGSRQTSNQSQKVLPYVRQQQRYRKQNQLQYRTRYSHPALL